jgi:hypothetical protein
VEETTESLSTLWAVCLCKLFGQSMSVSSMLVVWLIAPIRRSSSLKPLGRARKTCPNWRTLPAGRQVVMFLAGGREREREIYISPWLQVRITGPRHHLTSSLRATRRGTTRLMSIYNMFQVWSLGCAARSSMWFVMFYSHCGWCFAGWYMSGRVLSGFTGCSGCWLCPVPSTGSLCFVFSGTPCSS